MCAAIRQYLEVIHLAKRRRESKKQVEPPRYLPFAIIGAVLLAVIVVAVVSLRSKRDGSAELTNASPANPAPVTNLRNESVPPNLPANAMVTVEEYGDYQCPPCGQLHPEMKKIEQVYAGHIKFTFYNFPLTGGHKNAMAAAQAAEAARLQDRFEQMHDLIYENQNAWKDATDPRPAFTNYARQIGLDLTRFARDMGSTEVQQRIAADQQRGSALGVVGTPTIFIDGRELKPDLTNGEGIRKGIALMLYQRPVR